VRPAEAAELVRRVLATDKVRRVYGRKAAVLYAALLADDPEAHAYVTAWLDPAAVAHARAAHAQTARTARAAARYEAQALDLADASYRGTAALARAARGRDVWLYHGTTSRFTPAIVRDGLRPGVHRIDAKQAGIFLTARPGGSLHDGGTASWYARRAASVFGGAPAVLRVRVPFDTLTLDADDADIAAGAYQFVATAIPPEDICELDGARLRGRCRV